MTASPEIARVLVTGSAGQLGTFIVRAFADCTVLPCTRDSLDIARADGVARIINDAKPHLIINCAAYNDVDGAEDHPLDALASNTFGVRNLARAAESVGASLVHYSTDFVFAGNDRPNLEPYDEAAVPAPRSTYAASKLLGEWFAAAAPRAFVLRVESLFGTPRGWTGRRGTLESIVMNLEQERDVRAFTDRIVTPSYVADVAAATRHLVDTRAEPGLYHCVNSGQASWFEVAREAAGLLGVTPRIQPITTDQVSMKAQRPRFCALSNRKLAAAGFTMPTWQNGLHRWLMAR